MNPYRRVARDVTFALMIVCNVMLVVAHFDMGPLPFDAWFALWLMLAVVFWILK